MKETRVRVGPKPLANYIPSIVYHFQDSDEIEISAAGSNIPKMEYLIKLFTVFNVREESRAFENNPKMKMQILVVKLKRTDI